MKLRKSELVIVGIVLISILIGIYLYPQMPDMMASHWGIVGEVNGYLPKFWGLFFMPVLSIVILALFIVIPRIDPLKANIEKFRRYYDMFIVLLTLFMFYLYVITLLWNTGMRFNIMQLLSPAFGVLMYYTGVTLENAKRNWFIGIRTPWTMSSDENWSRTNKLGGKLMKAAGIISFFGILLPNYALWIILAPVLAAALYPVVYSYLIYNGKKRPKKK